MIPTNKQTTQNNEAEPIHLGIRSSSWDRHDSVKQEHFLVKLDERFSLNFEYLLMNCLVAIFLIGGLLSGQLAVFLLALLVAPTLTPVFAANFAFSMVSRSLLKKALGAFLLTSGIIFLAGLFAGFIAVQFSELPKPVWIEFLGFSWGNAALIIVALLFATGIFLRNPMQSVSVANVGLAFIYYLPLGTAGYLITSGESGFILSSLITFLFNIGFAIASGTLLLLIFGARRKSKAVLIPVISVVLIVVGLIILSLFLRQDKNPPIVVESGQSEQAKSTRTATIQPTISGITLPTLIATDILEEGGTILPLITIEPSHTPTITLTPLPTPVWAEIQAPESNGANVRSEPGYKGKILTSILNGTLVQVLPEVEVVDGNTWVHIRLQDQAEGWVVRSLLVSSTPIAEW